MVYPERPKLIYGFILVLGHVKILMKLFSMKIALYTLCSDITARIIWIGKNCLYIYLSFFNFVDTMGNFPALLLKNLCHDLNTLSRFLVVRSFTVESLLKDLQEMLPYQVPLIVIDHIAAPFRAFRSIETVAERVEAIEAVGRGFRKLGRGRPTLFLYINQLTTRFIQQSDGTGRIPLLVPALGESWSIFCDVDIRLEYNCKTQERRLTIVRADYIEEHQVGKSLRFQITVINLS